MKVLTPEISWHEREPIYSVDFQPGQHGIHRVASGGVDKIVRIWQFKHDEEGKGTVEFLCNLRRHTATVNVVRFSKNGELLATAGDDSTIILWKLSDVPTPSNNIFAEDDGEEDKETWVCHKTLRGHLEDVADLSWSKDSRFLISGSVDNTAIVWDVIKEKKVAMFREHKSYVQGVAFDPMGDLVATMSSDRSMRIFNLTSKNCVNNVSKMVLPHSQAPPTPKDKDSNPASDTKPKQFRIFHDDSFRSFFRRLEFTPDGQLLIAPAGCMETSEGKLVNASFIFARGAFSKPALYLPSVEKVTTAIRVNPQLYELRPADGDNKPVDTDAGSKPAKEWEKHKSLFCLPYRMVFSVATEDSIIIYDTQQAMPIGLLKNIHYHQISDMSWSEDGKALIVASTDGFCTIATFEDGELGLLYKKPSDLEETVPEDSTPTKSCPVVPMEVDTNNSEKDNKVATVVLTKDMEDNKTSDIASTQCKDLEDKKQSPSEKTDAPVTSSLDNSSTEKPVDSQKEKNILEETTSNEKKAQTDVKSELTEGVKSVSISDQKSAILSNNKSVSISDDKSVSISDDKSVSISDEKSTNGQQDKTSVSPSMTETPKRKRIQLTTISLKAKD